MSYSPISILGFGQTSFGELWDRSLLDLFQTAINLALDNAQLKPTDIDAIYVSNMASGNYETQLHLNSMVSSLLPHHPPAFRLEAACASGSLAVVAATHALQAGTYHRVLVVGAEKMTDCDTTTSTKILSSAGNNYTEYGGTFPGLYSLLADLYLTRYHLSQPTLRRALSLISSRAHESAITNPFAQFRRPITAKAVSQSTCVAGMLRLLDCSPLSDGAAALILTSDPDRTLYPHTPHLIGVGHAQDSLDLSSRQDLPHLTATSSATNQVFAGSSLTLADISAIELHDCFTIAEILAIEDIGFLPKGKAARTLDRLGYYRESLVVNPSGGLKACGHPVGATGIKQIGFLSNYLTGRNKHNPYGLTHNVGGTGGTVIMHLIEGGNKAHD